MNSREEELQVILDVLGGNKDAYSLLVDKYKNKIFGLLHKMGLSTEDAQDVTQETFIKAYRKLASHQLDKSFAGWIYTIAIRTYKERFRGNKNVYYDPIPSDLLSPHATPEDEVIEQENIDELACYVNELPSNYRLLILLRYTNDLTYEEIEQITGFDKNQIKNGLHRAKKTLKKILNKKGVVIDDMLEHNRDRGIIIK